ncbi:MAG: hypothetical protein AB8G16_17625 [Gammaproteobacteria bacterium]
MKIRNKKVRLQLAWLPRDAVGLPENASWISALAVLSGNAGEVAAAALLLSRGEALQGYVLSGLLITSCGMHAGVISGRIRDWNCPGSVMLGYLALAVR